MTLPQSDVVVFAHLDSQSQFGIDAVRGLGVLLGGHCCGVGRVWRRGQRTDLFLEKMNVFSGFR